MPITTIQNCFACFASCASFFRLLASFDIAIYSSIVDLHQFTKKKTIPQNIRVKITFRGNYSEQN